MNSSPHQISTSYLRWSLIVLGFAGVWLLRAELQPTCAEPYYSVPWYSDCRQSQRGKLLFWWPILVAGALALRSLIYNFRRVRRHGEWFLVAWLRYLGAITFGVGIWIGSYFLSSFLVELQVTSQLGGESAGWAFLIFWGGFAALLTVSIPVVAVVFFLAQRRWKGARW